MYLRDEIFLRLLEGGGQLMCLRMMLPNTEVFLHSLLLCATEK